MKLSKYDVSTYDFRKVVEKYLEYDDLEHIHLKHPFQTPLVSGTDQNQYLHKLFYSRMDSDAEFVLLYRKFLKEIIVPMHENIIVQKFPTFRIHQPDNICVFGWHKDKDYNHNANEINYFLPITKAYASNTIWYQHDGNGQELPIEAEYGETIAWDAAKLRHGNKINNTAQTRISFDFRVLEKKHYDESEVKKTISKGRKLALGHYFDYV